MKIIMLLLSASLCLSGCGIMRMHEQAKQEAQENALYTPCLQYQKFVDKATCINKVASTDQLLFKHPAEQELIAYLAVLAEKVKARTMTETEAKFEYQHKKNDLLQQQAQMRAMDSTANANNAINKPRTTYCSSVGNSVNCTSY